MDNKQKRLVAFKALFSISAEQSAKNTHISALGKDWRPTDEEIAELAEEADGQEILDNIAKFEVERDVYLKNCGKKLGDLLRKLREHVQDLQTNEGTHSAPTVSISTAKPKEKTKKVNILDASDLPTVNAPTVKLVANTIVQPVADDKKEKKSEEVPLAEVLPADKVDRFQNGKQIPMRNTHSSLLGTTVKVTSEKRTDSEEDDDNDRERYKPREPRRDRERGRRTGRPAQAESQPVENPLADQQPPVSDQQPPPPKATVPIPIVPTLKQSSKLPDPILRLLQTPEWHETRSEIERAFIQSRDSKLETRSSGTQMIDAWINRMGLYRDGAVGDDGIIFGRYMTKCIAALQRGVSTDSAEYQCDYVTGGKTSQET